MPGLLKSSLRPHDKGPRREARSGPRQARHLRRVRQDHSQLEVTHEDAHRRETLLVRQVRKKLLQLENASQSQKDAYERATVCL